MKLPDGRHIEYVIDGQNRRVGKRMCATAIDVPCATALDEGFVYRNQLQLAAWLNPDGSVRARFVYGGRANVPEYMVVPAGQTNAGTYRLVLDQVGTVRLVVDAANGAVLERLDYDEFGKATDTTVSAVHWTPFGFAGGLADWDTGLVRLGRGTMRRRRGGGRTRTR